MCNDAVVDLDEVKIYHLDIDINKLDVFLSTIKGLLLC